MPKVYNKKDKNVPKEAVYIGRPSFMGNPFVIGMDGDREAVCQKYELWIETNPSLKRRIIEACKDKDLVCWCAPERCHGDYILKIANQEDSVSSAPAPKD